MTARVHAWLAGRPCTVCQTGPHDTTAGHPYEPEIQPADRRAARLDASRRARAAARRHREFAGGDAA